MIQYKKMSLFDAPKGSVIIHACNSQGMWGSGIAKEFAHRYPESYKHYVQFCNNYNVLSGSACGYSGMSIYPKDENHWVGWIVTSHDYGNKKDNPELIKIHTTLALKNLLDVFDNTHSKLEKINIYSNKFNSGLFNVPWEESELILKTVLKNYKRINWIVCDPELKD